MSRLPSWEWGEPLVTLQNKQGNRNIIPLSIHSPVTWVRLVLAARHERLLWHQVPELRCLVGASPCAASTLHVFSLDVQLVRLILIFYKTQLFSLFLLSIHCWKLIWKQIDYIQYKMIIKAGQRFMNKWTAFIIFKVSMFFRSRQQQHNDDSYILAPNYIE